MSKIKVEKGSISPAPVVIVSCSDGEKDDLATVAYAGNFSSEPPYIYVSLSNESFAQKIIKKSGEFAVNLCDEKMLRAADICGVYSGKTVDVWEKSGLTRIKANEIAAPVVDESPLSIECRLKDVLTFGEQNVLIGEALCFDADESLIDEYGRFRIEKAGLLSYVNKNYLSIGEVLESMGFSVRRKSSGNRQKKVKNS